MIISLLRDMIKHSQSTQSNKCAISLQYFEKEVRNGVKFLHADKYQNFYKLLNEFTMNNIRIVNKITVLKSKS